VSHIRIEQPGSDVFSVTSPQSYPVSVAIKGTLPIKVKFRPTDLGDNPEKEAKLRIDYSFERETRFSSLTLKGRAVKYKPPELSKTGLDFGEVWTMRSNTLVLGIANPETLSVQVKIRSNDDAFSLEPDTLSLDPTKKGTISIKFAPPRGGSRKTELKVSYTVGSESGALEGVDLIGEGWEIPWIGIVPIGIGILSLIGLPAFISFFRR
jgi:hypothetical protein